MDIENWLRRIGFGQYVELFRANDIDFKLLKGLSGDDLKDIGVVSLGHRRKLLEAIADLDASAAAPWPASTAAIPPSMAERRQLTVMFVDLVGSTALSARLDPEDMSGMLRSYQETVTAEITRNGGYVAKLMGDGVLAYFGWPRAGEDDTERAVRAGLSIAESVGRLAAPSGEPLAARIGIATGLVVVGDLIGEGSAREETVVGETPNLAARLQGLATPGAVIIAGNTRRMLGEIFELRELAPSLLKGFRHAVQAFEVLGERRGPTRFEVRQSGPITPMVGRDPELSLILELPVTRERPSGRSCNNWVLPPVSRQTTLKW